MLKLTMKKIACVFSHKLSSWVSCQKIVSNIHKAYEQRGDLDLSNHNYTEPIEADDITTAKEDIFAIKPDAIVFMDHKPHPVHLLVLLLPLYKNIPKKPRLIFHVFGDFTLYYQQWSSLGDSMKDYQVNFIVASERQKILIDKFLTLPMTCDVCPFPVDHHEFHEDPKLRTAQREKWGISEEVKAFVYTGRLSRQKRILLVLKTFAEAFRTTGANCQLYLYGNPDFIADQFIGLWEVEGEYFRRIHRLHSSFPDEIKKRIHFMGNVHNKDLKSVYLGADYLVNMSVHNDEDYGMSVAEAQCTGLPAILTDWGGLAGFAMPEILNATTFIPVRIGERSKIVAKSQFSKAVVRAMTDTTKIDRKKIAKLAHERVGTKAAGNILSNILNSKAHPFVEYSPFFEQIVMRTHFTGRVHLTKSRKINNIYRELYSSYVRPD